MRPTGNQRPSRRPPSGWLGRDGWRAAAALLCAIFLLALGAHLGGWSAPLSGLPNSGQPARDAEDLTTGSLLIVPMFGNDCRQRRIDNATWRVWDDGVVRCDVALAQAADRRAQEIASRVDIIRMGFSKR